MPYIGWLDNSVTKGCVVALIFLSLSGNCIAQSDNIVSPQEIQPTFDTKPASQSVAQQFQSKAEVDYYQVSCEHPKTREDDDLCQQRRMAKATEDAVWWASIQTKIGIAGFFAVIFSLVFTGWAAVAAAQAAKAARASVDVAKDTAKRQLRAYLTGAESDIEPFEGGWALKVVLRNSGQTPAFDVRIMGESFGESYPLAVEKPHPEPGATHATVVGAGEDVWCVQRIFSENVEQSLEQLKTGKFGAWIQGTVVYVDCFGDSHKTKFRYVWGGRLATNGGAILHADNYGNEAD
jgi:hypothetical protein